MMPRTVFGIEAVSSKEGSSVRRVSAIVVFVALAALTPFAAAAQEATPPPGAEVLGPEECRVSPRSPEAMLAVFATPAAEPGAAATDVPAPGEQRTVASEDEFPTGEPADAATAEAVEAVVREFMACANARDVLRLFSLLSDDFLQSRSVRGWDAADGGGAGNGGRDAAHPGIRGRPPADSGDPRRAGLP